MLCVKKGERESLTKLLLTLFKTQYNPYEMKIVIFLIISTVYSSVAFGNFQKSQDYLKKIGQLYEASRLELWADGKYNSETSFLQVKGKFVIF